MIKLILLLCFTLQIARPASCANGDGSDAPVLIERTSCSYEDFGLTPSGVARFEKLEYQWKIEGTLETGQFLNEIATLYNEIQPSRFMFLSTDDDNINFRKFFEIYDEVQTSLKANNCSGEVFQNVKRFAFSVAWILLANNPDIFSKDQEYPETSYADVKSSSKLMSSTRPKTALRLSYNHTAVNSSLFCRYEDFNLSSSIVLKYRELDYQVVVENTITYEKFYTEVIKLYLKMQPSTFMSFPRNSDYVINFHPLLHYEADFKDVAGVVYGIMRYLGRYCRPSPTTVSMYDLIYFANSISYAINDYPCAAYEYGSPFEDIKDTANELSQLTCYTVAHFAIATLSMLGNILVLHSVIRDKNKNHQMLVKASLASSDLLSMMGVFVIAILELVQRSSLKGVSTYESYEDKKTLCVDDWLARGISITNDYIVNPAISVSFYQISLMSVLKCYAVMNPISYRVSVSKQKIYFIISALWIVPLSIAVVVNYFQQNPQVYLDLYFSKLPSDDTQNDLPPFYVITGVLTLIVPFAITIVSLFILCICFFRYRQTRKTLRANQGSNNKQQSKDQQERLISKEATNFIIKMLLIVLGYTLTCLPFTIFNYITAVQLLTSSNYDNRGSKPFVLSLQAITFDGVYKNYLSHRYLFTILYLNSIVDIVVYSMLDAHFQNYLRDCFKTVQMRISGN